MATVSCPTCEKPVDLSIKTAFRPFCSERCKLIDLGAWANEEYKVAARPTAEDMGELDINSEDNTDWEDTPLH